MDRGRQLGDAAGATDLEHVDLRGGECLQVCLQPPGQPLVLALLCKRSIAQSDSTAQQSVAALSCLSCQDAAADRVRLPATLLQPVPATHARDMAHAPKPQLLGPSPLPPTSEHPFEAGVGVAAEQTGPALHQVVGGLLLVVVQQRKPAGMGHLCCWLSIGSLVPSILGQVSAFLPAMTSSG